MQLKYVCNLYEQIYENGYLFCCRSQWPRVLNRGSAAARLPGLWVWIPPGHGYLSLVIVVCCRVGISASGWSVVQRSPTACGVSNRSWSWSHDNDEVLAHWGVVAPWGDFFFSTLWYSVFFYIFEYYEYFLIWILILKPMLKRFQKIFNCNMDWPG